MATHYLAYGSNLHPHRLTRRIPSAMLVGKVSIPGNRLVFSKRSRDGSAKCMFEASGSSANILHAALYRLDTPDRPVLDDIEGLGQGYDEQVMYVTMDGSTYQAFTYAAAISHVDRNLLPYRWYKDLVLLGAAYHRFPDTYLAAIRSIPAIEDPDPARAAGKEQLLSAMRDLNADRGCATG